MPKVKIVNALRTGRGANAVGDKMELYEITAVGGAGVLVEASPKNRTIVAAEIRCLYFQYLEF